MFVWWRGEQVKEWKNKMKGQESKTPNLWNVSQTSLSQCWKLSLNWLYDKYKNNVFASITLYVSRMTID